MCYLFSCHGVEHILCTHSCNSVDFYGDNGRYTGEVNDKKLPHGVGQITYDHGLVQEGKWVDGVLDEDTSVMSGATRQAGNVSSEGRRRSRSKDP